MENSLLEIKPQLLPNLGYLETRLPPAILKFLDNAIKNKKKKKYNPNLAGNIGSSYLIPDKNNWFFNNVLQKFIPLYNNSFGEGVAAQQTLTKDCRYVLKTMWVNYQQKHQFNPLHDHAGVFSFVIWLKIPFSVEEEKNVPFAKHSHNPSASCFEFSYCNSVGRIRNKLFSLSPESEGIMLFFPSLLMHQVYPFYTSNGDRISISGNISYDPEQIVKR
tara:strand:+ start:188 stop:841 length:654 start_codon:yes stop_codon:yes gene_type:complete